ncbi:MAG: GNAT family N-acetyltransferase [Arachnia sp.]
MTPEQFPVLLREATVKDHADVAKICRASGRTPWSLEALAPIPGRVAIVATVSGEVVGVAKTHLQEEAEGDAPAGHYLGGLVVDPRRRRKGLGSVLTNARLEWIWERSHCAFYFTDAVNTASIELHRHFGFVPIATAPTIRGVSADDEGGNVVLHEAVAAPGGHRRIRRSSPPVGSR